MLKHLGITGLVLIAISMPEILSAQEGCSIKTSDGRVLKLNFCGTAPQQRIQPNNSNTPTLKVLPTIKNEPLLYTNTGSARSWLPVGNSGGSNLFLSEDSSQNVLSEFYIRVEDPFSNDIRTVVVKGSMGCNSKQILLGNGDQYSANNQPVARNVYLNKIIEAPQLMLSKYCKN